LTLSQAFVGRHVLSHVAIHGGTRRATASEMMSWTRRAKRKPVASSDQSAWAYCSGCVDASDRHACQSVCLTLRGFELGGEPGVSPGGLGGIHSDDMVSGIDDVSTCHQTARDGLPSGLWSRIQRLGTYIRNMGKDASCSCDAKGQLTAAHPTSPAAAAGTATCTSLSKCVS
jgi:hypothetical protein